MNNLELLRQRRGTLRATVVRNPTRVSYGPMDHEIYGNFMVYQVGSIGVRVALSPQTGEFSGIPIIFDTEIGSLGATQNGPEFGVNANGQAIYYVKKDVNEWYQIWRATISGGDVTTEQITSTPHHKVNVLPTTDTSRSSTLLAYVAQGYVRVVDEADPHNAQNVTLALSSETASMRWTRGTSRLLACKGESPNRGAIVEWSDGYVRTCTPNPTDILYDPYGFYCPELGGEAAVVTVGPGFAGRSLRVFRRHAIDDWEAVHDIPFPQKAKAFSQNFLYSVEAAVFSGKTYFMLTITDRVGWITIGATRAQVWICTFDGEWTLVDGGGTQDKHHELESYLSTAGKFFVFWNEITPQGVWLWRAEVVDAP